MSLFDTMLLLLPPVALVLNSTVPVPTDGEPVAEPCKDVFFTVLAFAPLMKRTVLVPAVFEAVVLARVSALPPLFRPSMVTLAAPLRSTSGLPAAIAPLMLRAKPPSGLTETAA